MLSVFLGTCEAVSAMHHYISGPSSTSNYPPPSLNPMGASTSMSTIPSSGADTNDDDEEDEEDEAETMVGKGSEGEALIGGIAAAQRELEEHDGADVVLTERKLQHWAHRDIKPVRFSLESSLFYADTYWMV